ncbi:DUF5681 domain-containing protein [Methylobacterium sp. WSM2598]|uniref:DUF5681 domain-containing protein n=1 Tax=Methylobacterium sp. WSM2598 TaxID=398261 RepID=UPI0012F6E886
MQQRAGFQKGRSGNPSGRPRGSRSRATLALEVIFDGEAKEISRKAIEFAKAGDTVALRLCLERLVPPRRDRPVPFALPPIDTAADLTKATAALLDAVAQGDLTPSEAAELGRLVDVHLKAVEATEFASRLAALEQSTKAKS